MRGIELSRAFYEEFGKPMIERDFADFKDRIAVGLVGSGSECFGFDDGVSRDHDFGPSFCLWLTEEDEHEIGFRLFRAYSKLPKEYKGISVKEKSLGGSARGVMIVSDFYRRYTGRSGAPETLSDWLYTPSHYLAEAINGEVFCDPLGEFTAIREQIRHGMPEDVRLKKIASSAFYMAQSGQYNYKRCLDHGERGASRLALADFVRNSLEMAFLLNRSHMPYYKWAFRAMRGLELLGDKSDLLEQLISGETDPLHTSDMIEEFCACVIDEMKRQGLTVSDSDYLENHAFAVNDKVRDSGVRNLPIML